MSEETPRQRLNRIIFGTAPGAGRNFDIILIVMIVASVAALFMDSVASIHQQ